MNNTQVLQDIIHLVNQTDCMMVKYRFHYHRFEAWTTFDPFKLAFECVGSV